jgi:hypothetical protein
MGVNKQGRFGLNFTKKNLSLEFWSQENDME